MINGDRIKFIKIIFLLLIKFSLNLFKSLKLFLTNLLSVILKKVILSKSSIGFDTSPTFKSFKTLKIFLDIELVSIQPKSPFFTDEEDILILEAVSPKPKI